MVPLDDDVRRRDPRATTHGERDVGLARGNIVTDYKPSFLGAVMKHIACTPNRNFDEADYDQGVIEPAARIRALQQQLNDQRPSDEQIQQVIHWLLGIFETKNVDVDEREDRIRELLDRYELHPLFPDLLPLKNSR